MAGLPALGIHGFLVTTGRQGAGGKARNPPWCDRQVGLDKRKAARYGLTSTEKWSLVGRLLGARHNSLCDNTGTSGPHVGAVPRLRTP